MKQNNITKGRFAIAVILLLAGVALVGQGSYIKIKASLAQWLIASSWSERDANAQANTYLQIQAQKPWPWADTWVDARLSVPRLNISQYVMKDASGESLAFGPGTIDTSPTPGQSQQADTRIIAGHRDTHFSFLEDLQQGDRIYLEKYNGTKLAYAVHNISVFDSSESALQLDQSQSGLLLITCWPFDTMVPGGPLRYLVEAYAVGPESNVKDDLHLASQ